MRQETRTSSHSQIIHQGIILIYSTVQGYTNTVDRQHSQSKSRASAKFLSPSAGGCFHHRLLPPLWRTRAGRAPTCIAARSFRCFPHPRLAAGRLPLRELCRARRHGQRDHSQIALAGARPVLSRAGFDGSSRHHPGLLLTLLTCVDMC